MVEKRKSFRKKYKNEILAYGLLAIPLLFWSVFGFLPVLFGMALGFFKWRGFDTPSFVGLDNFIYFFKTDYYYMSLVRTFTIGGICFFSGLIMSLFIAVMVNGLTKFKTFFRSVWYVPTVISGVVATLIFNIILDPTNGVLNTLRIDAGKDPIMWAQETNWGIFWIAIYSNWKGIGGAIILWLAALQSIDKSLDEAGALDGAGKWQIFWKIRFPQMMPIISYILITGFSGMMQIYEQVLFITNGGPNGTTAVLAFRIMRDAFWDSNYGMAGASSVIMLIFSFSFTLVIFGRQRREVKAHG